MTAEFGAVSLKALHNAPFQNTPTVQEVIGAENWVTSDVPFLLDPNNIAKMQS